MSVALSDADLEALKRTARTTPILIRVGLVVSVVAVVSLALNGYMLAKIRGAGEQIREQGGTIKQLIEQGDRRDAAQQVSNAKISADRTNQLNGILANQSLIRDCVGLDEGGPCRAKTLAGQASFAIQFKKDLVEALQKEFGILKGELKITVVQQPGQPATITVGGSQPGSQPTKQTPLPLGTLVQECVVELHAEPVVGACAVPR